MYKSLRRHLVTAALSCLILLFMAALPGHCSVAGTPGLCSSSAFIDTEGSPVVLNDQVLHAGHLERKNGQIMDRLSNGGLLKSKWFSFYGKKFYFDKNGVAVTGLRKIGRYSYLFSKLGVLQTKDQIFKGKLYKIRQNGTIASITVSGSTTAVSGTTTAVSGTTSTASKSVSASTSRAASMGKKVADYARRFIGTPYKWGGSDLRNGVDCSGFVMAVYAHYGVSLPHYDASIRKCGKEVKSLARAIPGDVICYDGHVAIYLGNNRIVHSTSSQHGVCIWNNAAYTRILSIRRFF